MFLRFTPSNFKVTSPLFALVCLAFPGALKAASALPAHDGLSPGGGGYGSGGLKLVDWGVVTVYLAIVLAVGWYYSREQTNRKEFFTASNRHVSPILTGISLYATLLSIITYLGKPGEVINKGPFLIVAQFIAAPLAFVVVGWLVVPRLMRVRVTSAFELLESRLGSSIRLIGALMFIALRLIWMATVIHLSSIALVVTFGIPSEYTFLVTAGAALVSITYASMGGIRTVILTDVIQFSLLFLGAATTIGVITLKMGGLEWFPSEWSPHWDQQPWFSWDPTIRVTVFNAVVASVVWRVATASSDQTAVQRYMAVKDAAAARRSYLVTESSALIISVLLCLLGFALLGFFNSVPDALPNGMTIKKDADVLFPYFVGNYLPVGITGLVVCGLLAAATSSADSGVNAIAAVVTKDLLPRLGISQQSQWPEVRIARIMSFGIGITIIGLSYFVKFVPGNFLEIVNRTGNLFVQPIFCLFLLALWVPFATPLGAWLGFIAGIGTAIIVGFWNKLTGQPEISYHWIGPAALVADVVVAIGISYFGPRRERFRTSLYVGLTAGVLIILLQLTVVILARNSF